MPNFRESLPHLAQIRWLLCIFSIGGDAKISSFRYLTRFENYQSGRSPKVVALFSAINFSSYIIELLQLHDTIQIKRN